MLREILLDSCAVGIGLWGKCGRFRPSSLGKLCSLELSRWAWWEFEDRNANRNAGSESQAGVVSEESKGSDGNQRDT